MSTLLAGGRWIRADLRARTGQAVLTVLAVAGIVAALITAATLLEDSTNPWRSLSAQTDGAHVWIYTKDSPQVPLGGIDGVTQTAGPYRSAPVTVAQNGKKEPASLRAMPATPPAVAHPVVAEGRWLDPSQPDGVVVERSFARSLGLRIGAPFTIITINGERHTLYVRGIADSADQGFYPEWTPGLAYVLPLMLDRVEPMLGRSEWVTGLRLADPEASQVVSQRAVVLLEDRLQRVYTWREVRAAMELDNRLLGTLLALFGVVGLVAAALALANAAGGRVLGQLRDLATLKSMGFTRGQLALLLLAEHGALGLLGVAIGTLAGWGVMAAMLGAASVAPVPVLAIVGGTALAVLAAVGVPAWRGGRTPPIPAAPAAPPRGHLSRLARLALLVRLPPALVLGTRDAFTRRVPAFLTAFGLAVPMMMITIGLGVWATLDNFLAHPEQVGQHAALYVKPGKEEPAVAERLASQDKDVAEVYPGTDVNALAPGEARSVRVRAIGSSTSPYPFPVAEGRMYARQGEAVAGQGLLDLLGLKIGDRVRLTVGGTPLIVRIVGRTVEPEQDGEVLSVGLDSLAAKDAVPPEYYALALKPGADPQEVRGRLLASSQEGLDVQAAVNPADRLSVIRVVIVALIAVLALIGLANLLTASALGLRDHAFDLAVLKAMGLTPRQVMATLVTGTGLLVVLGVGVGAAAGVSVVTGLIDWQGHTSGVGAGIGRAPSPLTLVVAVLVAVGTALAVALIPARRAARAQVPVTSR
ncbi:ABC-type antimicrobial peptide transport system, permease component [[Actinomadura] parvosata subsp. kistnae]|uniref:ABC transporter permease n=1 Tax=[Actinomadura] parvosata subsp. kistnae TaxID=1909395 RepID=A0A1V0A7S5_9ACTN|nr:FtsX-like permease family protein [Nonomuraea sp. ATCC 55076]AQZ66254.1 ABC transporter permease [Nonomuraea sp. ATCC 55076]SPL97774.1 ABC-type antimicrobial peptide transport system, permease component [Actinomadura parvosata subsp. kistnae]